MARNDQIPGPALLGFGDFFFDDVFVGAVKPPPPKPLNKSSLKPPPKPSGKTPPKAPPRAPGKPKYAPGSKRPSPHRLAFGNSTTAAQRALKAAAAAKAKVAKYKKDAKSGSHGTLIPLKPTKVRGDGIIMLGVVAPPRVLTPQQKAAVAAHAKSIGKNAMAARRLNIAAAKAQRAGTGALAFAKKTAPLVQRKLAGTKFTPGPRGATRVKGYDDLDLAYLLGEDEYVDPSMYDLEGGTDQDLMNQSGAGGVDPGTGMVFAPDGSVLYDPSQDPAVIPKPVRGQALADATIVFKKVPEDGIAYDGSRDRTMGGVPFASLKFWSGVSGAGYYYQPVNGKWYRREGGGEGATNYKDYECTGPGDSWPRTGVASIEQGFGPIIGKPGSDLANLQYAMDDQKFFWQSDNAPEWASAEVDAAIEAANKKTIEANQAAAIAQAAQIAKDQAEAEEAQRKQDAANALALSAADTQSQIADQALQAKQNEFDLVTSQADLEINKQDAALQLQQQAAQLQMLQQQAALDAAAQQSMIEQANIWNQWAKDHPEEAVAQMTQPVGPQEHADEGEGYDEGGEGYDGSYEGSGYDFAEGGEDDGEPMEDD